MSFTDPATVADPVTGTKATAALLNTWRADMEYLYQPRAGCRLRTNTATNLGGGAMVPFALEDFDNQGCHSTSSNTSRITVPTGWAGLWWFGFTIRVTSAQTFTVCLNGGTTGASVLATVNTFSTATHISSAVGFATARLAAGDYIELRGGGTLSVAAFNPVFWAQWRAG